MLIHHQPGHYYFLQGIDPYSCGVVSEPGHEIVHVNLVSLLPWSAGIRKAIEWLASIGGVATDICAMQLRCPAPHTMKGFKAFNAEYCELIENLGLYVDGCNPLARTNVAPQISVPSETSLFAFSYVRPAPKSQAPTFLIAGAGELPEGSLNESDIIRRGETSPDAISDKSAFVMKIMADRLHALNCIWQDVNRINIYTCHPCDAILRDVIVSETRDCNLQGLHVFSSRPPVEEIEFEMDMRGVRNEMFIDLT